MKKPNRILAAGLVIAALGVFTWLLMRLHEPVYQGKPLSSWLEGCDKSRWVGNEWQEANEAVRHVGTKAIPTLLRKLRKKDSPLTLKLFALLAQKQHFISIHHVPASAQNHKAAVGFEVLGPEARPAVPALIKIFNEAISDDSQCETAISLGWIGPGASAAIPSLAAGLTNANGTLQRQLAKVLLQLHAEASRTAVMALAENNAAWDLVVPGLAKALTDPSPEVRKNALDGLAGYGPFQAGPAILGIKKCLNDDHADVREKAGNILRGFAATLVPLLDSPDAMVGSNARRTLKFIDPEAAEKAGVQ